MPKESSAYAEKYRTEGFAQNICIACGNEKDGNYCRTCLDERGIVNRGTRKRLLTSEQMTKLNIGHRQCFLDCDYGDQGVVL